MVWQGDNDHTTNEYFFMATPQTDAFIYPHHKPILFVTTPNSLVPASLNFFSQSTQQSSVCTRHPNCVSLTLLVYHVFVRSVGWIKICRVRTQLLFDTELLVTLFARRTLASFSGLFICVGVEKRPGIDCNVHARNLHIRCYSLMCTFTCNDVITV